MIKKSLLTLLTTIAFASGVCGFAMEVGHDTAEDAVRAVLSSVRSGESDGISPQIMEKLNGRLSGSEMTSYKKLGEEVRLGGNMYKVYYDLFFKRGPKKQVTFMVIRPAEQAGYRVIDVSVFSVGLTKD